MDDHLQSAAESWCKAHTPSSGCREVLIAFIQAPSSGKFCTVHEGICFYGAITSLVEPLPMQRLNYPLLPLLSILTITTFPSSQIATYIPHQPETSISLLISILSCFPQEQQDLLSSHYHLRFDYRYISTYRPALWHSAVFYSTDFLTSAKSNHCGVQESSALAVRSVMKQSQSSTGACISAQPQR
jgi:hypothetical protein